jgi:hypothetical protein
MATRILLAALGVAPWLGFAASAELGALGVAAGLGLVATHLACGWGCARGFTGARAIRAVFGLELAALFAVAVAAACRGEHWIDVAIAAAILPYPGAIAAAHCLARSS